MVVSRPFRGFGDPAAVRARRHEFVAVNVNWMIGYAEIAHLYANPVAKPHRQWVDAGKIAEIPGPQEGWCQGCWNCGQCVSAWNEDSDHF